MPRHTRSLPALLLAAATLAACAQTSADSATRALDQGTVTVWLIHMSAPARTPPRSARAKGPAAGTARIPPPMVASAVNAPPLSREIHEQTAGSFGTAASDVGETAGSYGQPASTLGTPASEHGHLASEHGQTAASFGTASSTYGAGSAGSYGQTAGSFGESLATLADAGRRQAPTGPVIVPADGLQSRLLGGEYPNVHLLVVDLAPGELGAEIARRAGTPLAPDVLMGDSLPPEWATGLAREHGIVSLASPIWWAQTPRGNFGQPANAGPQLAILRSAAHPAEARALAILLAGACPARGGPSPPPQFEEAAVLAYRSMLTGGAWSQADAQSATFDTGLTAAALLPHPDWAGADVRAQVDICQTAHRQGLAMVAMRGILAGPDSFGVVHGLAILRPDPDKPGRWRVLTLSPNLSAEQIAQAFSLFDILPTHPAAPPAPHVTPVSPAAPADGDNRSPRPDLWWDTHPGAELQVLEYQPGDGKQWESPRLLWLPNHIEHDRTRVTASFADIGSFRWRVWSIGPAGQTVLSPWRTFNIVR